MRLRLLSDLHLCFMGDRGKSFIQSLNPDGVDVLCLAGDVMDMHVGFYDTLKLFSDQFRCPIVFVHGNHSFYNSNREVVVNSTLDAVSKIQGVHWLDCSSVTINGQRFLGTPLWYRRSRPPSNILSTEEEWQEGFIREYNTVTKQVYVSRWSDFRWIEDLSSWVYDQNSRALSFLLDNMSENDVVISHMLPSRLCVDVKYERSITNAWFVYDVEPLIVDRKPLVWCFGHTHTSHDFDLGNTRMVCNPLGYITAGEVNVSFDENKTIEVLPRKNNDNA